MATPITSTCETEAPITAPPAYPIRTFVPETAAPADDPAIPKFKTCCRFNGQIIVGNIS